MKAVIAALAIGFPLALVLAWAFEITPGGIKRAEDVIPNEAITHKTGRKLIRLTGALPVIAAGLLAFQFLSPKITRMTGAAAIAAPLDASLASGAIDQKSVDVPKEAP
jgi:hypothetical protein